ncbi:Enolase 1 [Hibiscus syriacus]|uniref:phosphopyruvate hydratase n=1 Tax=Hibiscus syriacus TaxID=106335 RepID=A0A6A2XBG7_HIBSY|nr:Enolase 1 [Hibiscus syriacus]
MDQSASTGIYETLELRDGDKTVYGGKVVLRLGFPTSLLSDREQGGLSRAAVAVPSRPESGRVGSDRGRGRGRGNTLYKHIQELSRTNELIMPVPAFNVINGGSHSGNNLAMQEFMILPVGATSFAEALRMGNEDPFDQDDWSSWASLQSSVNIQLIGDDLLVTNPKRISEAIQKKACNALLLKLLPF